MTQALIACGDVSLLKRIVGDLPDEFEPIASKTGEGIARKVEGRDVPLAIVHEQLQDGATTQLCRDLQRLEVPPAILLLADDPPDDGPFDRAIRYPVPGPVLRNAIQDLLETDDEEEDLEKWKAFYKEVKRRVAELPEEDYYELLGVAPDAPHHAIVEAYDRLSMRYHPDRYQQYRDEKWGRALHEKVGRLYTLLTEAFQVLSDRKLRKRYDQLRDQGELRMPGDELSSPDTGPQSLTDFAETSQGRKYLRMAQTEIAKENYRDALQNLQFAASAEPANDAISEKIDEIEQKIES